MTDRLSRRLSSHTDEPRIRSGASRRQAKSRLAELQPLAGRNPMLARKIIKNEKLGLKQDKPEHTL
ncbi:MAG: hypothetical protein QNJ70_30990 [Xenococcaceae cyanobacterium MO_207.B15]|nr:hypothetical protein [Xenococcaceae cyanobacterium MO_207.B15]